jgi:chemotaxis signal transduction protein
VTNVAKVAKVADVAKVGFLVVTAGGSRYGLVLADVREVVDLAPAREVPARSTALRGIMPLRERFVSLVHLASLVSGSTPPPVASETAVVVNVRGTPMALEVDDVEEVIDRTADFVGPAPMAWATGVWRVGTELVTVLDLGVLAERILETGSAHDAAG